MEILTIDELMHLTRDELCALSQHLEWQLIGSEAGSATRMRALTSLANIRRVMTRRGLHS